MGAEQKYYSPKLEFLALKLVFCDHLKECLYYAKSCDVYTDNNSFVYVMSTGKLNAAGQRWPRELCDYTFIIHYKPEDTVAHALSRPTKMHKIRDKGKQVRIPTEEVSSILSSTDNNFKEKSMWIATLNAAGVVDQIDNRFPDEKTLTVIPPLHLKNMQQ